MLAALLCRCALFLLSCQKLFAFCRRWNGWTEKALSIFHRSAFSQHKHQQNVWCALKFRCSFALPLDITISGRIRSQKRKQHGHKNLCIYLCGSFFPNATFHSYVYIVILNSYTHTCTYAIQIFLCLDTTIRSFAFFYYVFYGWGELVFK